RADPSNAKAYYNYGNLYAARGDCPAAIKLYRDAVRLDPTYPVAHLNLGVCLHERGEAAEAIASVREALRLQPDLLDAARNLALLLTTAEPASLRNPSEAVRLAEEVVRRDDAHAGHLLLRATAYAAAGRFDAAIAAPPRAYDLAVVQGDDAEKDAAAEQLRGYQARPPASTLPVPRSPRRADPRRPAR